MRYIGIGLLLLLQPLLVLRAPAQPGTRQHPWVSSWAAAQMSAEPQNMLPESKRHDVTLRQIVHLSLGGDQLQIRLSNAFGTTALTIDSVRVGIPVSASQPDIQPGTDRAVTFNRHDGISIPAGADYISDPIDLAAAPLSNVAVSFHFLDLPEEETAHPGSRATSYLRAGNAAVDPKFEGAFKTEHWFFLSELDVRAAQITADSVAVLGDSITDGHGATTDANNRWTDILAQRLQQDSHTRNSAVINLGVGGNRLLHDGLGPNALARLDRDILARPGVRYLVVLEGINDLGTLARTATASDADHEALVRDIIAAYEQIIRRAHQHQILVYGATVLPDRGSVYYHPDAANEADRQAVNQWIRTPGNFDAVIDFDSSVKDPQQPDRLLPSFDSGDHLHPSAAGYEVMGDSIPLTLFGASGRKR